MAIEKTSPREPGGKRLIPDIGTVMLTAFARDSHPLKALFVGVEPGGYMILRYPPGAPVNDHLYEGNHLVIKFVHAGKVYGFQSRVKGYIFKPGLILGVISYPDAVETIELRKEQRVDFFVPAELEAGAEKLKGFVVDISPGGCKFAFELQNETPPFDFENIKKAFISFQLVGREGDWTFSCQIKKVTAEPRSVSLGLQFEKVEASITEGIRRYVNQVADFLEWGRK
ncbi:MAG: PilZ domain-containing protein [Pseudomonadota bacterium]